MQCGDWLLMGFVMISVCFMLGVVLTFSSLRVLMSILSSYCLFTIARRYLKKKYSEKPNLRKIVTLSLARILLV